MNRILTSIKSNIGRLSALTSRFTLIVLALLICIPCPCAEQLFAQRLNESVYFKNFVRHSDGTFCTHTSPTATFTVYLNRDQRKIVMENAPRWDTGGDPNIDGKGVFGVELGNFAEPSLAVGDSVFVRFTCNETGEQGILSDKVTAIPFYRFPLTLTLARVQLPPRIENVQLTIDEFGQRVLTWQHAPDITSTIYRRAVSDTALNGLSRKLYTRIAENNTGGSFIDTCTS
ncbi:hypothetical protein JXJ21_00045, partial [candidate division KSB1 bacterium]|nr:hypothetical protein [candidate division KSB1 bacterium]